MNRRDRRAAVARGEAAATAAPADIAELLAAANRAYQLGQPAQAEDVCKRILARAPANATCLNLLGLAYQAAGRHRLAIKQFAKAIAVDDLDAGFQYNIGCSYQTMNEVAAAAVHFKKAIVLGLSGKSVEEFVLQNRGVMDRVKQLTNKPAEHIENGRPFGADEIGALAKDIFFRCALETTLFRSLGIELLLTHLRRALLGRAMTAATGVDGETLGLFCALARQCFINEFVFDQNDEETRHAQQMRGALLREIADNGEISPLLLAAVAAYFPLNTLAPAKLLLDRQWPACIVELLQQVVAEPLAEAEECRAIPALTAIDDGISLEVMRQYEENPYPRWTVNPFAVLSGEMKRHGETVPGSPGEDILVAGCGTGKQAIRIAQFFPNARILALDISRASLAYAQRKTRDEGLRNVEYAQADILKLGGLNRSFDRIEAVGVLHHLSDPKAGWRTLLSLLRPHGIMRIGLYSETGRRSYADAFALIAERGYRALPEDIRALRRTVIRAWNDRRWHVLINTADFYSMSGCRDLLFNAMEHRFTIPEIARFLDENGLSFLGFELDPNVVKTFQQQYPDAAALTDLDCWNAFETANPETFLQMYRFSVRRRN